MKRKILVVMLALSLVFVSSGLAAAGVLGYSLDRTDRGFERRPDSQPSSSVVFFDAGVARPLGLVTTAGGVVLFTITAPFHVISGDSRSAADSLIAKPGGWTFVRPMGRGDKRFEEQGVFGR